MKNTQFITIRKEGHSRVIVITKILPVDWRHVNATVTKSTDGIVTVKFERVQ